MTPVLINLLSTRRKDELLLLLWRQGLDLMNDLPGGHEQRPRQTLSGQTPFQACCQTTAVSRLNGHPASHVCQNQRAMIQVDSPGFVAVIRTFHRERRSAVSVMPFPRSILGATTWEP